MALAEARPTATKKVHRLSHLNPATGLQGKIQDGHFSWTQRILLEVQGGGLTDALAKRHMTGDEYLQTEMGEKLQERAAREHTRRITRDWVSTETHNPERFWEQCLDSADSFIQHYVARILFPYTNQGNLVDEVALATEDPAMLREIANDSRTDEIRYRFELLRKRVLAEIIADTKSQSHELQLKRTLLGIHHMLDDRLFTEGKGGLHQSVTYAVHEDKTGKVIGLYPTRAAAEAALLPDMHIRTHDDPTRSVEGIGDVLCHVREKSDEATLAKVLRYAVNGGGEPDHVIETAIRDRTGLMFIVKGVMSSFDPKVTELADKATILVVSHLRTEFGDAYQEGDISIEIDDRNGNPEDPTQSDQIHFQRRIVHIKGRPPVELIFYGEGDRINSQTNVGTYNEETGRYSGGAESLYMMDRLMGLLTYLYPPSIPGYEGLYAIAQAAYQEEAQRLLAIRDEQ